MSDTFSEVAELFASADVPERLAGEAVARLGETAAQDLRDDPWRLLTLPGVRPEQADFFARRLLGDITPDDPRRGAALTEHLLLRAARDGNTAVPVQTVLSALPALEPGDPVQAARAAMDAGLAVAVMDDARQEELLSLARYATAEDSLAEGLARLTATAEPMPGHEHGVSVLSGPPDAVDRAVGALVATEGLNVVVAAATDRAAARYKRAVSLRRLLEHGEDGYGRNEDRPLEADVVVITEAAALDLERAAALVDACLDGTHLVLAGDPMTPAPIGPGQVFTDVLACGAIPVTKLDDAPADAIGTLTAAARNGELVAVESPEKAVVIVPAGEGREAAHRAVQLMTDSIPRALGIAAEDVLVVTPAQRGEAGTVALNQALKQRLNPGDGPYDPGDRVIALTDLPQAAAGEIGTVTEADGQTAGVAFPGGDASVPVAALRHGWAVTVHRAQGTRWPAVVAVLPGEAASALTRQVVVGAFSRAGRHLSVVHAAGPDLAKAVGERAEPARRTRLAGLLKEQLADVEP